jgi:hypothetical protein
MVMSVTADFPAMKGDEHEKIRREIRITILESFFIK